MAESTSDEARFDQASEQRVLDAIAARHVADFSGLPSAKRRLRAGFLQRLISGSSGAHGELCAPLRIRGADIIGPLLPPSATDHGGRVAVQFRACSFDSPVDFSGAEFLVLRLVDCSLPAFIGASLRVSADLDLSGSQFSGVTEYESELSQVGSCTIHLNNARIGGRLELFSTDTARFSAAGIVRLDGARVEGDVNLSGALLDGGGAAAVSARSINVGGNVYLRTASGHRCEANAVAVEKIRMRLAARVDRPWARIFPNVLMLISHYGYSSSRAAMSFLIFVLFGTAMYATALFVFQQPFLPVENDPSSVTYEFAFGLARHVTENGCPGLHVMHYALDAALPVVDLGQDLRCQFTPVEPGRSIWLLLHSSLYIITGAALSAVVVLTLTGVLRQD